MLMEIEKSQRRELRMVDVDTLINEKFIKS